MRHKITKAFRAEIARIADMLPADTYEARTSTKYGHELLNENPDAVDGKGNKLDPKLLYTLPVQYPINHKNRLESAFKANGVKGINKYLDKYRVKPAEEVSAQNL